MSFSNSFKIIWWFIILVFLTVFGYARFNAGVFNNFDTYLLVFWFILLLFPIISEVSIFGVSIKKEIESVKGELKSYIASIKTDIQSHLDFRPTINNTFNAPVPANQSEYEKKVKNEVREEIQEIEKGSKTILSATPSQEMIKRTNNEKSRERIEKVLQIERLVSDYFQIFYGKYQSQMKLENDDSGNKMIVDGLVIDSDNAAIKQIVEVKLITSKSFDTFYFIANRFIAKLFKLGSRIPVKFVIVSEQMDIDGARILKMQLNKLNSNRDANPRLPLVSGLFFKFEDGKINEIRI